MKQKKNTGPADPFSGSEFALPEEPAAKSAAAPKKRFSGSKKRNKAGSVVRIEDIEQTLRESGEDVDPDAVISYYLPRRRFKLFGAEVFSARSCRKVGRAEIYRVSPRADSGNYRVDSSAGSENFNFIIHHQTKRTGARAYIPCLGSFFDYFAYLQEEGVQ